MAEKIRTVLVGCGAITGAWFRGLEGRDDVEIAGLVDLSQEAADALAEARGLDAPTGTDLEAMLDAVRPEAVFDCTVPAAHHDVTLAALRRGCHVLGEKPLADSMERARAMEQAAREAGAVYAVIQNRRYQSAIRTVRSALASGVLGEVTGVQSDFFLGPRFGGFREEMDHVLLLDMAIHTFDAARYLSGLDPVSVYAEEWNPAHSWYAHGAAAAGIFRMNNDARYVYHGCWCAQGLSTSWEAGWRFLCTQGSLLWDGAESIRAERKEEDGVRPLEVEWVDLPAERLGHGGVIDDFLRAVRGGPAPMTAVEDNLKSLAMVHGAIASAESGERVSI